MESQLLITSKISNDLHVTDKNKLNRGNYPLVLLSTIYMFSFKTGSVRLVAMYLYCTVFYSTMQCIYTVLYHHIIKPNLIWYPALIMLYRKIRRNSLKALTWKYLILLMWIIHRIMVQVNYTLSIRHLPSGWMGGVGWNNHLYIIICLLLLFSMFFVCILEPPH